jgi:hypothetical protein
MVACSVLILCTVGGSPWTGDQPFARPILTHKCKFYVDGCSVALTGCDTRSERLGRMRPSYCSLSAKLVPTIADTGCYVVSVTDPLRPCSRFSRPEPLLFLPSSSSVVLTRLSGPRSRPTTSQRIW